MKKTIRQMLWVCLLAPFLLVSCNDDDNKGSASITFDSTSVNDPYSDSFHLSGKVKSKDGSEIDILTITALYRERVENQNPNIDDSTYAYEKLILASLGDDGITKVNDHEYKFYISPENNTYLSAMRNTIYAIEVTAHVKKGDRSSRTWEIDQMD